MPDVATSLLDFILDLLRDPAAARRFQADPHAALSAAGLQGVSEADVHALVPVALDYAPVALHSSFDRTYAGSADGGLHGHVGAGLHSPAHSPDDTHVHL